MEVDAVFWTFAVEVVPLVEEATDDDAEEEVEDGFVVVLFTVELLTGFVLVADEDAAVLGFVAVELLVGRLVLVETEEDELGLATAVLEEGFAELEDVVVRVTVEAAAGFVFLDEVLEGVALTED